jgi:predicted ATPase/class 3 adenylate cyclase
MPDLPDGDVAFLFTDIEGSTRLLERDARALGVAMARHHELLAGEVTAHRGVVFETVGDAVYAAFGDPADALRCAAAMQRAMAAEDWGLVGELRVRIAVHHGPVERRGDHYFGAPLFACARIQALAHGEQVLVSAAVGDAVRGRLDGGLAVRPLGAVRLRDLQDPLEVGQLEGPGLRSAFPPLRTGGPADRSTLPVAMSGLVGRDAEIDALAGAITDARLVTVLGPGGTGKTRLAVETARRLGPGIPDGAHLVELAPVTDPERVPDAIAAALRVRPYADQSILDALRAHLAGRELLLLVDNCEHLPASGAVLGRLLGAAPGLRIIATSRTPLGLPGERRFPLGPLDPAGPGVALFLERARAVDPSFDPDDAEHAATVELCRRLDGLPLAIELAAARVAFLPPSRLLDRFPERLDLAAGGPAVLDARQRTLRDTIAWSTALLGPRDRAAFAALSVFVDDLDLDGAAAVVGPLVDDPLALVAHLLDASLLVRRAPDERGEPRFGMLATIAAHAAELAATDPAAQAAAEARHGAWFLRVATEARRAIDGNRVREGLAAMARAMPDIEATIERAVFRGDGDLACATAATLYEYCEMRGGRIRAEELVRLALSVSCAPGVRADALNTAGFLAQRLERPDAVSLLREAHSLAEQVDDQALLADIETNLGNEAAIRGDLAAARRFHRRSIARWHAIGDPSTAHRLAPAGASAGDRPDYERLLAEARAIGNDFSVETILYNLADWHRRSGDPRVALGLNQEGLRIAVELDSVDAILDDLEAIADDLERIGAADRAARIAHACAAIRADRPERPRWTGDASDPDAAGHRDPRGSPREIADPPLPIERLIELALADP